MKYTVWPRPVKRPAELPLGLQKPVGKGFESFAAGVRPLSLLVLTCVEQKKPYCGIELLLRPFPQLLPKKMPYPALTTVDAPRLYANPTRGAKFLLLLCQSPVASRIASCLPQATMGADSMSVATSIPM